MNKLIFTIATLLFALFSASLSAQNIAAKRGQLAVGQNSVRIVEQSDVQQAVRTIEQRTKKTKVNG